MENYKDMYFTLFNATAKAIELLQNAQLRTEDMYISKEEQENLGERQEDNL